VLETGLNHRIDGIAPGSTDTDDLDMDRHHIAFM
jgi:hypothetical protein